MRARRRHRAAPLLARIAGLPSDAVERLSTTLCDDAAAAARVETELAAARVELADRLHTLVPGAGPALRRLLLAVKRDVFNGRSLARHVEAPEWAELRALVPDAERVRALEAEAAARAAAFEAQFARERERQRAELVSHLDDAAFVRGVALSNREAGLIRQRLRGPSGEGHGRRKAELTLLRYVSRAAVKLSPFSTFTRVGLAELRDDARGGIPRIAAGAWRERSLVRIKPYLLEQYGEMLRRYPPLRATLPVLLNSSLEETEPGCFRFLKPAHWDFDEKAERLGYYDRKLVTVRLRGTLVTRLLEILGEASPPLGEVISVLERGMAPHGTAAQVAAHVDQLLRLGLLHLLLPWDDGQSPHLEKRMLRHLRALPGDPALQRFVDRLDALVRLQEGYPQVDDPIAAVREMESLVGELWRAAAPLGGLGADAGYGRASIHNVYEEVFLRPVARAGGAPAVLHLSRAAADEALRSVRPLVRLTALFDHRHDFLHAMAAFTTERWPDADAVPLTALFAEIRPLWQEYLQYRLDARKDQGWRTTWNPLALPEVDELARHREAALSALEGCLRVYGEVQRLSVQGLEGVMDALPARYTSDTGGAALFLQPASADGSLWMLNRVKEGTGRFSSRYTPAMDRATRRGYAMRLAARGTWKVEGEPAELLDLLCTQGDNLNVHAPQTPALLSLPGERAGVAAGRELRLRDLRVTFHGRDRIPALRGPCGRRFVAAYLGVAYEDYIPTPIRFLSLFGPGEMGAVFPPPASHAEGEVTVSRRTVLGNVVLHRRTWSFPATALRARLVGLDEARAFAAMARWREEHGIPARVFASERNTHPVAGVRVQPQYLDFTSPAFASLFRSMLDCGEETVVLVEMLPGPELFSRGPDGRRWAVEVLVDSLAMRPAAQLPARGADPPSLSLPAAVAAGG